MTFSGIVLALVCAPSFRVTLAAGMPWGVLLPLFVVGVLLGVWRGWATGQR